MRKLKIEITLEDDVFERELEHEVSVLLNHVAERIGSGLNEGKIRSTEGNTCGKWAIIGK